MPEGPEARTVADKLRPVLINRVILNALKDDQGKTLGFENLKCPVTIIGVRSHGKKVLIDISSEHMIIVSLGMGGRLQYTLGNNTHIKFDIGEYQITGPFRVLKPVGSLFYDDPRHMGHIDIIPNAGLSLYFMNIGPDLMAAALDEKTWITLDRWLAIFTQKKLLKRTIRQVLMDQDLVASIGNYLLSEILYYSGIMPRRIVETITIEEWDRIRINSHKVLLLSYSCGGCTLESFISPDGSLGLYQTVVYGKTHDPLGNLVIVTKEKDGRNSHWVPEVQH